MDYENINRCTDNLFQSWKIVPIFLVLIYIGISIEFFNIEPIDAILDISFIFVIIWNFWKLYGIKNNKILNLAYKLHSFYLFVMPIIIGSFLSVNYVMTLKQLVFGYLIAFLLSLLLSYFSLMKRSDKKTTEVYYKKSFQVMEYVLLLLILFFTSVRQYISINFSFILSNLSHDTAAYITCALALVLLFATLSLLSYTYVIAQKDSKKNEKSNEEMLKSANYFFKSTLLSIITLCLIFISSVYLNNFRVYLGLNSILNVYSFNIASIYSVLLVMSLLALVYCVITGIRGVIHSSSVLKIGWHIG